MGSALAPVAALLFSVALLLAGHGLQGTLLPVRASMESFSTVSIGILGSWYYLGFAAGCIFGPVLVHRAGHIRTFTAMAAIASAVPLVHGLAVLPIAWWLMRGFTGFCFAVLYIVIESWLNERATDKTRGSILSVYMIINLMVMTIGQMMVTFYDPADLSSFALASVLVSLAAVPVALTAAAAPAPIQSVSVNVRRLYRISPEGFIGCLVQGLISGSFWAYGPLFAEHSGLAVPGIALFMSIVVLGGAAGQWPVGRFSDRLDRRWVLLGCCVGAAVAGIVMVLIDRFTPMAFLLAAGWGVFMFPVYSIAIAHTNDYAHPGERVLVSSGLLLVFAAGAIAGPLLMSPILELISSRWLFAGTAAFHTGLGVYVYWRITRQAPTPAAEHTAFADAMVSAGTVSPVFDTELSPEGTKEQS